MLIEMITKRPIFLSGLISDTKTLIEQRKIFLEQTKVSRTYVDPDKLEGASLRIYNDYACLAERVLAYANSLDWLADRCERAEFIRTTSCLWRSVLAQLEGVCAIICKMECRCGG